ncbi:MAG: hypothetical protein B6230_01855 [Desulfobacteraceae bacterium 4572_89]|nr:MAG: hypothetical protein B6230_01855 [Desulfobacteraceae bacterium 4572_89]
MAGINQINELTQSLGNESIGAPKTREKGEFSNVLTKALDKKPNNKTDKTEPPEMGNTKAPALGEITSTDLHIQDQSYVVSGKTDSLLELLDAYASKLEDPGVSLKSIAPVLEQISQNADNLLKETASLGTGENGLKDVATQTVVAAQTEYLKFQRGDYLS